MKNYFYISDTNVSDAVSSGNSMGFVDGNTNPALDDYEYDSNDFRVKDFEKVFCEETERSSEWQDELNLNMYDMDMRQYDPAIARWVVMDPVIHHSMSPYSAFDNNPVFWTDPSGAAPEIGSVFEQSGMKVGSLTVQGTGTSIGAGGAQEDNGGLSDSEVEADYLSSQIPNISNDPIDSDGSIKENNIFEDNTLPEGFDGAAIGNKNPCPKCWWLNNDEYLTFEEAIWHYRLGKGEPVDVRLSKIDLSFLKVSDFENPDFIHQGNPGRRVRLSSIDRLVGGNRSEGLVYGTIDVVYIGGNKVMALPNEYDFNMNWEQSIRGFSRDIATFNGGLYVSMRMGGQSYWIQFIGTATIK